MPTIRDARPPGDGARLRPGAAAAVFAALLLLLPAAPAGAQRVSVQEVRPARVRLMAGGRTESVALRGSGLAAVTSASLTVRGTNVRGVRAGVRITARNELTVSLAADASAASVDGTLTLRARDGSSVTVQGLDVTVVAQPAVRSVTAADAALVEGERSTLTVALSAPAGADLAVKLSATGREVTLPSGVRVRAGARSIRVPFTVGPVSRPVKVQIEAGTATGAAATTIEVSPRPVFAPRRAATPALVFAGLHFEPRRAATPALIFAGLHFEPRRVATPALVFTGLSFEPRRITTPALVMTGVSSDTVR